MTVGLTLAVADLSPSATIPQTVVGGWVSLQVSEQLDGAGGWTLTLARGGSQVNVVLEAFDPVLILSSDGVERWRGVVDTVDNDGVSPTLTLSGRSMLALLDRVTVWSEASDPSIDPPGLRFTDATPGEIMGALISRAVTRGGLPGMDLSTLASIATVDSDGRTWPETVTEDLPAERTVLQVLTDLTDRGLIVARMDGATLLLFTPADGPAVADPIPAQDPPGATGIILHLGRDALSQTESRQPARVVTDALILDDNRGRSTATDAGAAALYGRRESVATVGGVDAASRAARASARLVTAPDVARQVRITTDRFAPWSSYRVRDTLVVAAGDGRAPAVRRIVGMALDAPSEGGVTVTLDLDHPEPDPQLVLARRLRALEQSVPATLPNAPYRSPGAGQAAPTDKYVEVHQIPGTDHDAVSFHEGAGTARWQSYTAGGAGLVVGAGADGSGGGYAEIAVAGLTYDLQDRNLQNNSVHQVANLYGTNDALKIALNQFGNFDLVFPSTRVVRRGDEHRLVVDVLCNSRRRWQHPLLLRTADCRRIECPHHRPLLVRLRRDRRRGVRRVVGAGAQDRHPQGPDRRPGSGPRYAGAGVPPLAVPAAGEG